MPNIEAWRMWSAARFAVSGEFTSSQFVFMASYLTETSILCHKNDEVRSAIQCSVVVYLFSFIMLLGFTK
jgi:hypothetical protein